jgi:hypothetical protein
LLCDEHVRDAMLSTGSHAVWAIDLDLVRSNGTAQLIVPDAPEGFGARLLTEQQSLGVGADMSPDMQRDLAGVINRAILLMTLLFDSDGASGASDAPLPPVLDFSAWEAQLGEPQND